MAQFKFQEWLGSDDDQIQTQTRRTEAPKVEVSTISAPVAILRPAMPAAGAAGDYTDVEMARLQSRQARFKASGVGEIAAQAVAWRLIERDRDRDDRRSCAECRHQSYEHCRKGLFPVGGFGIEILHRCRGFTE